MIHTALTLICNPDTPLLKETLLTEIDGILRETTSGEVNRRCLAPGIAEDFLYASEIGAKEIHAKISTVLGDKPIDLGFQPSQFRQKMLLIADMDSTIIEQECIDELADHAGRRAEISAITEQAMRGELDFNAALAERVSMLAGLHREVIDKTIRERITLTSGAKTLVATMASWGAQAALVSGGFTAFTDRISDMVGFSHTRANQLVINDNILTGEVARPILGRDAKRAALDELLQEHTLAPGQSIAVGDGANDLAMIERAGLGVAFHAKPAVAAAADVAINHGDLTALLYLQGIRQSDFVKT